MGFLICTPSAHLYSYLWHVKYGQNKSSNNKNMDGTMESKQKKKNNV